MAKKVVEETVKEIKKALEEKKVVFGADVTLKNLKTGKVSLIYLTSNCPEELKENILHHAKVGGIAIREISYSDEELGIICKKPFSISVLTILKE